VSESERAVAEVLDRQRDEDRHRVLPRYHEINHVVRYQIIGHPIARVIDKHINDIASEGFIIVLPLLTDDLFD